MGHQTFGCHIVAQELDQPGAVDSNIAAASFVDIGQVVEFVSYAAQQMAAVVIVAGCLDTSEHDHLEFWE